MSKLKVAALQGLSASSDAITLANDGTCTANITNNLSNRNLVMNGAMQVAQRGTSSTTAITGNTFVCDRFRTAGNSQIGVVTASQTTTNLPAGFDHALRYECTTADTSIAAGDHFGIMYVPESQDLARIAKGTSSAKPLTLSFYVRSNVQRTFVVELTDSSNSRHVNFQKTVAAINTWERMVINIPADTSGSFGTGNSKAAELTWWLAAGTTYSSGSIQNTWTSRSNANIMAGTQNLNDTVGNFIEITGVQLEVGSVATDFEHRSFGDELNRCLRYCYVAGGTAPATDNYERFGTGWGYDSTRTRIQMFHPIPMRTAPTVSVPTIGDLQVSDSSNGYQCSAYERMGSVNGSMTTGIQFTHSSGVTAYRPMFVEARNTTAARIILSAEL